MEWDKVTTLQDTLEQWYEEQEDTEYRLERLTKAAQALSDSMKPSMQVQGEKMYALFDVKLVGDLREILEENNQTKGRANPYRDIC